MNDSVDIYRFIYFGTTFMDLAENVTNRKK